MRGVDESQNRRHNSASDGRCKDAVVSVGDTQRTSVGNKTCLLLGEKEKETYIEVRRWWLTTGEGLEDPEKDRRSELRSRTPGSKRNAMWASRRVVSVLDSLRDVRKSDVVKEGGIDVLGVV